MALRGVRLRLLINDEVARQQCLDAASETEATLLEGGALDEEAHVVIATSAAGPDFLVRLTLCALA